VHPRGSTRQADELVVVRVSPVLRVAKDLDVSASVRVAPRGILGEGEDIEVLHAVGGVEECRPVPGTAR
jgi:hypothetical protein